MTRNVLQEKPAAPMAGLAGLAAGAGLVCAILSLVVMAVRFHGALLTPEPTHAPTSGAEYESLYAIWKVAHGLAAYADQTRIPFAGSYYNWLYYESYGGLVAVLQSAFGLSDSWIPTIAKLTSLAGVTCGFAVSWTLSRRMLGLRSTFLAATAAAVWVLVFFGPLVGFWAIATAPDLWALTFDAASVLSFLALYERRPRLAVAVFAVLAYAAWSFKQVFVYSTGAVGLFLLLRRDWKGAILLSLLMVGGWAATVLAGSEQYRRMLFFGGSQITLSPERLARNLGNFAVKCAPLLAGLAALWWLLPERQDAARRHPAIVLALLGIAVSGLMSGAASAKLGASENYYFTTSFHLGLFLLAALASFEERGFRPRPVLAALAAGWLATSAALAGLLGGWVGQLSALNLQGLHALARCVGERPGPVFVSNPILALPWLVPSDPAFVLHWNYPLDRAAGVPMEGGGVGGLIESGYFGTLVLHEGAAEHDGGDLSAHYEVAEVCHGMAVFRRKER